MGSQYNCPRLVTNGLIFCLDAANNKSYPGSGTVWTDLSNSGNNGNFATSPTYSTTGVPRFNFNGTNQTVTTTIQYVNPQRYSLQVWFRTSILNARKIIGFENNQTGIGSSSYDRMIYIGTDGKIYFGQYPGATVTVTSSMSVNDNAWRCVVATFGGSGEGLRLYVNGVLDASGAVSSAQNYTGWWRLGGYRLAGWPNSTEGYFTGDIAIAQIYNRSLTPAEVLQNYNALKGRFGL